MVMSDIKTKPRPSSVRQNKPEKDSDKPLKKEVLLVYTTYRASPERASRRFPRL
jgi:hypothetical protein